VIGADSQGHIHFVTDEGDLRQDINEAAVFTDCGLEQAKHIARMTDLKQQRLCQYLTVITLTAGQLEALTAQSTNQSARPNGATAPPSSQQNASHED